MLAGEDLAEAGGEIGSNEIEVAEPLRLLLGGDLVEGGVWVAGLRPDDAPDPLAKEVPLVPAEAIEKAVGVPHHPPGVVHEPLEVEALQNGFHLGQGVVEAHQHGVDRPGRGTADPVDVPQNALGLQHLQGAHIGDPLHPAAFENQISKMVWHDRSSLRLTSVEPVDGSCWFRHHRWAARAQSPGTWPNPRSFSMRLNT